jgi:DNA primase large subunit
LANYPFLPEAGKYIRALEINIENLTASDLEPTLERAEERIREAILPGVSIGQLHSCDVEISSFPIAVLMVAASKNAHLKRRYALAEARKVYKLLSRETAIDKISAIAKNFNWSMRISDLHGPLAFDFALSFACYLKNASAIQDEKWKLANRLMLSGEVYITKHEADRLLQEEVRRYIEKRLELDVGTLPQNVTERIEKLTRLFLETRGKMQSEEMPTEVVPDAFPPCIRLLHKNALTGSHLSHIGRFTLTSFLVNTGMTVDAVVDCFRSASDFNERMTRYQAEHIAGGRGSRTRYIPPKCQTLRTHGVCQDMDDVCRTIHHPLRYYKEKLRTKKTSAKEQTIQAA